MEQENMKTLYIAGEGGHTARVISIIEKNLYPAQRTDIALTLEQDETWVTWVAQLGAIWIITKPNPLSTNLVKQVPRWIRAFWEAFKMLRSSNPDIVIGGCSNACIAPCVVAKAMGKRVVVAESFVQIDEPSRACKVLDKIVDETLTEWPHQNGWFRRPRYVGLLVPWHGASGLVDGDQTYPSMKLMKALQEGKRVKTAIRPDIPEGRQIRFIEFLQGLGYVDGDRWTVRGTFPDHKP